MSTEDDSNLGKDIDFKAPDIKAGETTGVESLVDHAKEEILKLNDELNNWIIALGADPEFATGKLDDEYRERSRLMQPLAPTDKEQNLDTDPFMIRYRNGGAGGYTNKISRARASIDSGIENGFTKYVDGYNFSTATIYDNQGGERFFLTEKESSLLESIHKKFTKIHQFYLDTLNNLFDQLSADEFKGGELQDYPDMCYQIGHNCRISYPEMPEDTAGRIDAVLEKCSFFWSQIDPDMKELNMSMNRFLFLIANIGIARLKFFEEKINKEENPLPHEIIEVHTESGGTRYLRTYDIGTYQTSEEDAQAANDKYLSWLKSDKENQDKGSGEK